MSDTTYDNGREVNIEKFDSADFDQEHCGFTQLSNIVIQNVTSPYAFHVWAYLQSKPRTWDPNRQELMNHFVIGEKKLTKILNFLISSNLLIAKQARNKDGSMGKYKIRVLNGSNFIKVDCIQMRDSKQSKEQTTAPPLTAPPVNRPPAYGDHINKEASTNKNTETKNTTTTTVPKLVEDICSSSNFYDSIVSNSNKEVETPLDVSFNKLRALGFCAADINELHNLYYNNLPKLQQSIEHLVFDAEVNKIADTIGIKLEYWFMKIMRKGHGFNAPKGFMKRNPQDPQNPQDLEKKLNNDICLKYFDEKKANWYLHLTRQEQLKIGLSVNDPRVNDYFANNVWPAIFDELKRKLEA